jgi:hypothetical protein
MMKEIGTTTTTIAADQTPKVDNSRGKRTFGDGQDQKVVRVRMI